MSITTISLSLKSLETWAEEAGVIVDAIGTSKGRAVALIYDPRRPHDQAYGVKTHGPAHAIDWMSPASASHEFALTIN